MKNPNELFGADIAAEIFGEKVEVRERGIPYKLPEYKLEDGSQLFPEALKWCCQLGFITIQKGWIDLDDIWNNFPSNEQETDLLNRLIEKNENIAMSWEYLSQARNALKEEYPMPFSGKKAYLMKLPIVPLSENVEMFEIVLDKNTLVPGTICKQTKNDGLFLKGVLQVFHNADLGWEEERIVKKKKTVEGVLKEVEEVEKTPKLEHWTSIFLENRQTDFLGESIPWLKENDKVGELFCYFVADFIKKGEWNGSPSHTINAVDFCFMG